MSDYPPDWEVLSLGEVVEKITSGGTPKADNPDLYGGNIPFLKIDDITSSSKYLRNHKVTINERGLSESSAKIVPTGTLLLTMYGTIGRCCITTYPVATNQAIASFLGHPRVELEYLYYALESKADEFAVASSQTTQANISAGILKQTPIAIPPLPEQKKIAEILSGIDRRSNVLSKQIAKEEALFTSFQDQLLESIASTAFAPMHRHDSQLKTLPIANLFEVQLGKMLNKEAKEHGHQFQYLGNKNIQQWNPDIRHLELMHFSEDEKRKFSLRSGDLLVCEGGDAGRCCIWEETDAEIYYQKAIHRMRPRSGECTPAFMMHYLAYCKSRNLLSDFISKTSISHLTREKLLEIPIAIPSLEEQSSIVEKLESQRKLIAKLFSKSNILKDIKSAVSSDLLSGRKRVSI